MSFHKKHAQYRYLDFSSRYNEDRMLHTSKDNPRKFHITNEELRIRMLEKEN